MSADARVKTITMPRPVFCVIEQAYRNRSVAEEVCAGRFAHIGITIERGIEPDWMGDDLPIDEEWRIEWSKFYYGLDLAHAFLKTHDRKYLRVWESLVRSWIGQVPVGFDVSDITGRRAQNWIYAWSMFARAPEFAGLSEGLEEEITQSLMEQVSHLRSHLTVERNHRTLELYALFIAALAMPEIDREGGLLDFAIDELYLNLLSDIRPDGTHRESSTHYHMTVLRSFLGARENARRFELALPGGYDERLEQACEFAMHCHRPDGLIPALSDSDTGNYADILQLAASIFSRPDFLYAATGGAEGIAAQKRHKSFHQGGYFIERSGWGDDKDCFRDERFLIFDCGPLGDGGHGHYDLLNVEIAANGHPLIVDPGRYTYSEQGENWRRWFKSTAAHNTVVVDGLDQTPYRRGKPKGPIAEGRFLERLSAPGFDMLSGEAISPSYEVIHTRRIFFIAGQYWIIADRLRGDRPHNFDLRFHLTAQAQDRVTAEAQGKNLMARAPGLGMVIDSTGALTIEQGWYAPAYGIKLPAPTLNVSVDGVAQTDFYTLIAPLKPGQSMPAFSVRASQAEPDQAIIFEIVNAGPDGSTTDLVAYSQSRKRVKLGAFRCRASAAFLRNTNGQSKLTACDVAELSQVSASRKPLLKSARPVRWAQWSKRGEITPGKGGQL